MSLSTQDRYRGALLGLAVGDCLGTTLEFTPHLRGHLPPLTTIVGGGPFNLPPGAWTDDTSMALCLAESLLARGGHVDPADVLDRWVRWWRHGENSSTGVCFDVGGTTAAALRRYVETGELWALADPRGAGNGVLMRLAPVALAAGPGHASTAAGLAIAQAWLTHGGPEAADAAGVFAAVLSMALGNLPKEELLEPSFLVGLAGTAAVERVVAGSYRTKPIELIHGSGYAVDCLEAALWAFWSTDDYGPAVLAAANLGEDADTTAAVTGQLAGAFYGASAIPPAWLDVLVDARRIELLADRLLGLAEGRLYVAAEAPTG